MVVPRENCFRRFSRQSFGSGSLPGAPVNQPNSKRFDSSNSSLRRLGFAKTEMNGHGFRSMASTLLNEQGWNRDAIERQLANAERDEVRTAYNFVGFELLSLVNTFPSQIETLRTPLCSKSSNVSAHCPPWRIRRTSLSYRNMLKRVSKLALNSRAFPHPRLRGRPRSCTTRWNIQLNAQILVDAVSSRCASLFCSGESLL